MHLYDLRVFWQMASILQLSRASAHSSTSAEKKEIKSLWVAIWRKINTCFRLGRVNRNSQAKSCWSSMTEQTHFTIPPKTWSEDERDDKRVELIPVQTRLWGLQHLILLWPLGPKPNSTLGSFSSALAFPAVELLLRIALAWQQNTFCPDKGQWGCHGYSNKGPSSNTLLHQNV